MSYRTALAAGEQVSYIAHPHFKRLILPVFVLSW